MRDLHRITSREQHPTILLVDDHEDTRRVYGTMLRYYGYTVEEAATGADAVTRARELIPDLILMDIGLPVLTGWEAAEVLKADMATRAIPILAFSATIDSIADVRSEHAVFDGFIVKPTSPVVLARRIAAYVDLIGSPMRHPGRHHQSRSMRPSA